MRRTSKRVMRNVHLGCIFGATVLLFFVDAQTVGAELAVVISNEQVNGYSNENIGKVENAPTILSRKSIRDKERKYHSKRGGYGSHRYYAPSDRRYFRYHRNQHLKPRTFQFRYKGHSPYGKGTYRFQRRPHYKSPYYRYEYRRPYIYRRHSRPHPYPPRRKHYRH